MEKSLERAFAADEKLGEIVKAEEAAWKETNVPEEVLLLAEAWMGILLLVGGMAIKTSRFLRRELDSRKGTPQNKVSERLDRKWAALNKALQASLEED